MPTTNLPPAVNAFAVGLKSAVDQKFITTAIDQQIGTGGGSAVAPNQYVVEAIDTFEQTIAGFSNTVTLLQTTVATTYAPLASPILTDATLNGTITANGVITANGSTGTSGQYLASGGSNNKPYWATFAVSGTPSLDAVVNVSGTTTRAVGISNTLAAGNTTITGFANLSSTLQTGGLATLYTANVGNTQISSLGIGTAASGTGGEIRATNNITAYYSDDRLKTRLGAIENALDKIDQLSGFYYEANELAQSLGYQKVREVAVSAQDTQKVMPEIVAPAPIDSRYLTVRYEKFAPLLIEGIKELRVELNNIKKHLGI